MASGNAVLQTLANAIIAAPLDTSGTNIACPGSLSFGHITAAGARILLNSPVGTLVLLLNTSGSTVEVTDSALVGVASLLDNEAALCVATEDGDYPWLSVVLTTAAT